MGARPSHIGFSRSDGISLDAADIVDVAAKGASDVERRRRRLREECAQRGENKEAGRSRLLKMKLFERQQRFVFKQLQLQPHQPVRQEAPGLHLL